MIELFALPVSAYCAKVRVVLDLKGIAYTETPPPDGYGSPRYRAIVPAGSIPAIRQGSFVLHDSDAIIEYLEDQYPNPPMRPENKQKRAVLRAIARYHDTALEPTIRAFFPLVECSRDGMGETFDTAYLNLNNALERLETIILHSAPPSPFLGGEQISLTDCGFPSTLQMANKLLQIFGRTLTLPPTLTEWLNTLNKVPEIAHSQSICRSAVDSWIATKISSGLPVNK